MEHHPADRTLRVGLKDAGDALQFNYTKVSYCDIIRGALRSVCARVFLFRSLLWRLLLLSLRYLLRCAAAAQPPPVHVAQVWLYTFSPEDIYRYYRGIAVAASMRGNVSPPRCCCCTVRALRGG